MKVLVNAHNIEITDKEVINKKEHKVSKCLFEFSSEYDDNFVKKALFTVSNKTYEMTIFNNQCEFPYEVLEKRGEAILGVYAYKIVDNELIKRFSPSPQSFYVSNGSYIENAENSKEITPSQLEQYQQELNNRLNEIPELIKKEIDNIDLGNINLDDYVKKVEGKDLSANDFTNDYKEKLDDLNNYDDTEVKKDISSLNEKIANIESIPGPQGPPGEKGDRGEVGPKGEQGEAGIDGKDGYIPQRGIDYWNEEDLNAIKEHCNNYIDENIVQVLGGSY